LAAQVGHRTPEIGKSWIPLIAYKAKKAKIIANAIINIILYLVLILVLNIKELNNAKATIAHKTIV
jgi:hypothetical protein